MLKASKIVAQLQEMIETHGDCEFTLQCCGTDDGYPESYLSLPNSSDIDSVQVVPLDSESYRIHPDGESRGDRVVFYINEG